MRDVEKRGPDVRGAPLEGGDHIAGETNEWMSGKCFLLQYRELPRIE